jgi:hypothetical protein
MNVEHVTERGPLSWMLECEKCEAAFVSPMRGARRSDPCPHCGGGIIALGAGYPTRDADGAIVSMDPVSMLSREVAEAMTAGVFEESPLMTTRKQYTIAGIAKPKRKKRSGKSPTRKVVPVARGHHARWERRMAESREPITLGGDTLDPVREAYPDAAVSHEVVAQMPEFNRLAGVRRLPLKWDGE